jgi:hypothetical protein
VAKAYQGYDIWAMVVLTQHPEEDESTICTEIQVLGQYEDVFSEPRSFHYKGFIITQYL